MKFRVSEKIFEDFPDVVEYIVVGTGLNNEVSAKEINDRLDKIASDLEGKKELLEQPNYQKWIEIYDSIQGKEQFTPSHVSLAQRAIDGKKVPHINPIVNFYNSYVLKYGVSIGGEDLEKIYGDLELKYSEGDELFLEIGGDKVETVGENEIIWRDDHSVTCRMWGWRQSERTKITKNTQNSYFIFDTFGEEIFEKMVEEFSEELVKIFGGQIEILKISKSLPEAVSQYKSMVLKSDNVTNRDLEQLIDTSKIEGKKSKASLFQRRAQSMEFLDQSHPTQKLSKIVDEKLKESEISEKSLLEFTRDPRFGDLYSTVAIREGKKKGVSPMEIGHDITELLKDIDEFESIEQAGNGFINIKLTSRYLSDLLQNFTKSGESISESGVGEDRVIVIESPSINPNAPAHIGHLRNLLLGRTLSRIFEKVGFTVEKDNLINDKDNKVCMAMWGYKNHGEGKTPESEGLKKDHFVGKYYVIGRSAYNTDPKAKREIDEMLKKLEEGEDEMTKLWKKITDWAFEGQLETFERLNEDRGYLWFESELWEGGKEIVENYLGKGVVERLSDGAVIGRIEDEYGVPDVILLRSDGTTVYHTQDLNLTLKRIEKFSPWKAIWVVGNEHILHFQRLFALLDKLEIIPIDNLYAYVYGMVLGKDGKKISSRGGGDTTADEILDLAKESAMKVLKDREMKGKDEIAEKVGQGAVRYEILSKDAFKDIVLDIDKAVSFTGKSGSYVMYAYTRANSILDKVGKGTEDMSEIKMSEIERTLLLKLLSYPEIVLSAANNYAPSVIADYSYEVANLFNNFYENVPVKDSKGGELNFRILLTQLTANVLKDSLGILGVEVIEKM